MSASAKLLGLVVIIAAFLRLYNIGETPPGFYPDEAIYANNGTEAWETGDFKVFYPENNGREGLWPNIIGFFVIKFGHEPWVPRSVAAVFGILTVLGTYFLAKELFEGNSGHRLPGSEQTQNSGGQNSKAFGFLISSGAKIALLSSFFLATSFWHILFSRIGFRAIMAPFFLVWGIYFLLLAFRRIKEQKKPKFHILNSVCSGLFYGLGFHTYIAYRATPLLILMIIFLYWHGNKEREIRKKILLSAFYFILSAAIIAAPLGVYFIKNPDDFFGRTTQVSIFNSPTPAKDLATNVVKTAGMFNLAGDWNWRHNYAGRPQLFWPVGVLFIIGVILGIRRLLKSRISSAEPQTISGGKISDNRNVSDSGFGNWKFGFAILFGWIFIAALPVAVSNEGLPHALRAILMAPPIFVLAGAGGIWLAGKAKSLISSLKNKNQNLKILNFAAGGSFFAILVLLIVEAYTTYFILWGRNPNIAGAFSENYAKIGRELKELPDQLPKYVVVETGGVLARGVPMPAQTVMFLTDTFTPAKQKEKNLFYVLPDKLNEIDKENSYVVYLK